MPTESSLVIKPGHCYLEGKGYGTPVVSITSGELVHLSIGAAVVQGCRHIVHAWQSSSFVSCTVLDAFERIDLEHKIAHAKSTWNMHQISRALRFRASRLTVNFFYTLICLP